MSCGLCGEFCESFWHVLENGNFKGYARGCAVLNVLLEFAVPILCIMSANSLPIVTTILLFIFSVVLGVLELPFCCIRFQQCRTLASLLRIFEIYWIRAILYLVLGVIMISVAVHVDNNNPASWYFGVMLPIISILYFMASCKGEKSTFDEASNIAQASNPSAEAGVERSAAKSESRIPEARHEVAIGIVDDETVQTNVADKGPVTDVNEAAKNSDLLRDALRAAAGSRM